MTEMLAPQFQAGRVRLVKIIILLLWIKDVQSVAFCNKLTEWTSDFYICAQQLDPKTQLIVRIGVGVQLEYLCDLIVSSDTHLKWEINHLFLGLGFPYPA